MNNYLANALSNIQSLPLPLADFPDVIVKGKLRLLDVVNMEALSLPERAAMIRLSQPCYSDDTGRIRTDGTLPALPGVPGNIIGRITRSLAAKGLINLYRPAQFNGGVLFVEIAHAYNYKKGFEAQMIQRTKDERAARRYAREVNRMRQSHEKGSDYCANEDGEGSVNEESIDVRLAASGRVVRLDNKDFFDCKHPGPDGQSKHKMFHKMPISGDKFIQRLYPSFDVYGALAPLPTCIRFFLESKADGYGRVLIDRQAIYGWLGRKITQIAKTSGVDDAIECLKDTGHLLAVSIDDKEYAYVRDSAQLRMGRIYYNSAIPQLHEAREFHHSTRQYEDFYAAQACNSIAKRLIHVRTKDSKGKTVKLHMSVEQLTEEFLHSYDATIKHYRGKGMSDLDICQLYSNMNNVMEGFEGTHLLWHAIRTNQSVDVLEGIIDNCPGVGTRDERSIDDTIHNAVLSYLFAGETVEAYMQRRRMEAVGLNAAAAVKSVKAVKQEYQIENQVVVYQAPVVKQIEEQALIIPAVKEVENPAVRAELLNEIRSNPQDMSVEDLADLDNLETEDLAQIVQDLLRKSLKQITVTSAVSAGPVPATPEGADSNRPAGQTTFGSRPKRIPSPAESQDTSVDAPTEITAEQIARLKEQTSQIKMPTSTSFKPKK